MANLLDRLRSAAAYVVKGAKTQAPYAGGPFAKIRTAVAITGFDPRRGAKMLRDFSRTNEWVRLAIDYRREQISMASWKIVRLDDPKQPPDPRIEKTVRQLFRFVNPKRESIETLFDMALDDILVLDAGCIEKEKNLGGQIVALWGVDGATIAPDPDWDGSNPNAMRYTQMIDGRKVCELRNDQLLYIMRTPTTYSPIGWSPVETLVRAIEADLYGETYDFEMLRRNAPAGLLSLGAGVPAQLVEEFREYYESEIAGTKQIAIFGGGEAGPGGAPTFTPFQRSNREQERQAYKEWLVKKIAAVFRVDKSIFNITESVNRATSKTQQSRTDEGLKALASMIARYVTREIIWEFDENHGFQFDELTDTDEKEQSDIDIAYVGSGVLTINEVRARMGLDPVEWGDNPWVPPTGPVPAEPPQLQEEEPEDDGPGGKEDDEEDDKPEGGKSAVPFVGRSARSANPKLGYLNISGQ